MSRGDLQEIKAMLQAQILGLVKHLIPEGHRSGNYWMAKNPTRHDNHAGSFFIWLTGAPGAWRDAATGETGDVLGLIAYIHGSDVKEALKWARGWLGIAAMPEAQRRQQVEQAKAHQEAEEKRQAAALVEDRRRALGTWLHCPHHTLLGTVAETYLAGRGIRLADLPRQPGALHFNPSQKHRESGRSFPVIIAKMDGADNKFVAIHRTFLAPDGSGKAPVEPARKIWPRFSGTGACVHLWRGETEMAPADAHRKGLWDRLAIVEGIEDGLSVVVACPEYRVWCAGTLGNIAAIRLPDCSAEVIVCADNDWGKPDAQKALERGLANLVRQGRRTVKVAHSPVGKDVNDALRWRA